MQIAMLKQLLNKKLIDEKEYEKIKKELMKQKEGKGASIRYSICDEKSGQ